MQLASNNGGPRQAIVVLRSLLESCNNCIAIHRLYRQRCNTDQGLDGSFTDHLGLLALIQLQLPLTTLHSGQLSRHIGGLARTPHIQAGQAGVQLDLVGTLIVVAHIHF